MRGLADAERLRRFLKALAREAEADGDVYLTGGATAVLLGWRESTIDADILCVPEHDSLYRALPRLKEELQLNVEIGASEACSSSGWEGSPTFTTTPTRRPWPRSNADTRRTSPTWHSSSVAPSSSPSGSGSCSRPSSPGSTAIPQSTPRLSGRGWRMCWGRDRREQAHLTSRLAPLEPQALAYDKPAVRVARWVHTARGDAGGGSRPGGAGGAAALGSATSGRPGARGAAPRRAGAHLIEEGLHRRDHRGGHGSAVSPVPAGHRRSSTAVPRREVRGGAGPGEPVEVASGAAIAGSRRRRRQAGQAGSHRGLSPVVGTSCPNVRGGRPRLPQVPGADEASRAGQSPASIARYLATVGEATEVPRRSPGRGPPYWKSRVLRRKVVGDEDEGRGHGAGEEVA
jgi:hypothetical protein